MLKFLPTGWFPYVEIQCFLLLCFLGWGGVGIITNVPFAPLLDLFVTRHATLHDLVLCLMLRYLIFLCGVGWGGVGWGGVGWGGDNNKRSLGSAT